MRYVFFFLFTLTLYAKEPHPITTIQKWCKEERKLTKRRFLLSGILASISPDGMPHSRTIQISAFEKGKGALFFAHKRSRKVNDFQCNPYASLTLCLPKTRRQIKLQGRVEELSSAEGERYWQALSLSKKFFFLSPREVEAIRIEREAQKKQSPSEKAPTALIPMPSTFLGYRLIPTEVIFYETPQRKLPKKEILVLEKGDWAFLRSEE